MISVNGLELRIERFPDGTPRINLNVDDIPDFENGGIFYMHVKWKYESDAELMYLIMLKKHLDANLTDITYLLTMDYLPNARMDRVHNEDEVFTLKYFCDVINSLNFSRVWVLDAHSNVSVALLNNCINKSPKQYIQMAIDNIKNENGKMVEIPTVLDNTEICDDDVENNIIEPSEPAKELVFDDVDLILYFPDAGAAKRYSSMFPEYKYCYGEKIRDWDTGKILGLEIRTNGVSLDDRIVLIIDDICSYGGSIYYSANEIASYSPKKIYAYVTHCEDSVLDTEKGTLIKDLENNTVERLFTTDSLYTGKHEKITVVGGM